MHIISSDSGNGSQVVVVVVVVVVEVEVEVEVVVVLLFNTNNIEGTLPALMHCAPRTYIPRISCYTKLQIVVKGFSKDSVSVRTTQAIRLKKNCHPFKRLGYPIEWLKLSVQNNNQPRHCSKHGGQTGRQMWPLRS